MNQRLLEIVRQFRSKHALVVGDYAADRYLYGKSSRLSREAPVIILRKTGETVVAGQAGNVAANIRSLGGRVSCLGLVGQDDAGRKLVASMRRLKIKTNHIMAGKNRPTITKTRIYAGGHHAARQQVLRLDDDSIMPPAAKELRQAERFIKKAATASGADAIDVVVVSDYGYGFVNEAIWSALKKMAAQRGIPLAVDSRFNLRRFTGATVVTPNESEAYAQMGLDLDQPAKIDVLGRKILKAVRSEGVILTRGNEGMVVLEPKRPARFLDIVGTDDIVDVTGAGDTVIATAGLAIAAGASILEAASLANYAGGIVVMKPGTSQVTQQELRDIVQNSE